MTEQKQLVEWLKRVNLPYQILFVAKRQEVLLQIGWFPPFKNWSRTFKSGYVEVETYDGDESKVDGYSACHHQFVFNTDGVLIKSGSWEG